MTKVVGSGDCGNSPKNLLLERLAVALASADVASIQECVVDEVAWMPVAGQPLTGVDALCAAVEARGAADEVTLRHVLSHGRGGAVDGVVKDAAGEQAFCHVFDFSNAKGTHVKAITTYRIALAP